MAAQLFMAREAWNCRFGLEDSWLIVYWITKVAAGLPSKTGGHFLLCGQNINAEIEQSNIYNEKDKVAGFVAIITSFEYAFSYFCPG